MIVVAHIVISAFGLHLWECGGGSLYEIWFRHASHLEFSLQEQAQ